MVSDRVHVMQMNGGKVGHMTQAWNDTHALRAPGWA